MPKQLIQNAILAALSMAVSTNLSAANEHMQVDTPGMEQCYGIAKAGQNDCGGSSNQCASSSKIDGDKNAWIMVPTGLCNKIVNGSTKPSDSKS